MSKDFILPADAPSMGYIVSMICISLAGSLGLPFMVWLGFDNIHKHNWAMVIVILFSGLICAGMLQSWKVVRSAMRQQQDGNLHSIKIAEKKFIYRKNEMVQEILLADILSIEDRNEPFLSSQNWSVRITYQMDSEQRRELIINAMDFLKSWEEQGKLGLLLSEAIRVNQE
jgi:hypothetical protein